MAAPIAAIAGWAYDSHGNESLKNARKIREEVNKSVELLGKSEKILEEAEAYALKIKRELNSIFKVFIQYQESLLEIDEFLTDVKGRDLDVDKALSKYSDDIIQTIQNGYALAAIMVDIMTTPIFKMKKIDGEIAHDEEGKPEMEQDVDGLQIVNASELEEVLQKSSEEKAPYLVG